MAADHRRSITFRLARAGRAYRTCAARRLAVFGVHPGQDMLLKVLSDADGQTMGALAGALEVRPPTITKMIARLSAQGLVRRETASDDARLTRVFLTGEGRTRALLVERTWADLESRALSGIVEKDRKKLRKLLRRVERNLAMEAGNEDGGDMSGAKGIAAE